MKRSRVTLVATMSAILAFHLSACTMFSTSDSVHGPSALTTRAPSEVSTPIHTESVAAPISDGGIREGSAGTTEPGSDGQPAIYLVAEGDNPAAIAERFGLRSLGQLKNQDGLRIGDNIPIFPGDRLVLLPNSPAS